MIPWYISDNYFVAEDTSPIVIVSWLAFSNLHLEAMQKHQSYALLHLKRFVYRYFFIVSHSQKTNYITIQVHIEETRGTLQFASRAKCVSNCAQVNEVCVKKLTFWTYLFFILLDVKNLTIMLMCHATTIMV